MSAPGTVDRRDWQSVARHVALALTASAATAVVDTTLQVVASGVVDPWDVVQRAGWAALTAVLAGAMRYLQRLRLSLDADGTATPPQ